MGSIILPIILLVLPADFFDHGPPICLSRILLDVECLACGLTRATMRLIHLDFAAAAQFNKMVFFIFPLVVYLWAKYIYIDYTYLTRPR